jgi:predicted nucleic acid-binding protein
MWFIDTNVFFYFYDDRFPQHQENSRAWLAKLAAGRLGVTNLQVANEFAHVVFRRLPHLDRTEVFGMADDILAWGSTALSTGTVSTARSVCIRYRYSWWDCLLLASALELGCTHFLSEDLQDGQTIGDLTIVDPFAHRPDEILSLP